MPLPLVIAGAAVLAKTALGNLAYEVSKEAAQRYIRPYLVNLGEEFLKSAAEEMGLVLNESGHLTDEAITAVINNKLLAGTGVQIDSLFDRDKLLAGLERLAVERLAAEVGLPLGGASTIGGIRGALQAWAGEQVVTALESEAGPIFEGATGSPFVARVIAGAVKNEGWNTPSDMTEKGVKNRERQARYRATHKKTWVKK